MFSLAMAWIPLSACLISFSSLFFFDELFVFQVFIQGIPRFFKFFQFHISYSSFFILLSLSLMRLSLVATLVTVSPVISAISS